MGNLNFGYYAALVVTVGGPYLRGWDPRSPGNGLSEPVFSHDTKGRNLNCVISAASRHSQGAAKWLAGVLTYMYIYIYMALPVLKTVIRVDRPPRTHVSASDVCHTSLSMLHSSHTAWSVSYAMATYITAGQRRDLELFSGAWATSSSSGPFLLTS